MKKRWRKKPARMRSWDDYYSDLLREEGKISSFLTNSRIHKLNKIEEETCSNSPLVLTEKESGMFTSTSYQDSILTGSSLGNMKRATNKLRDWETIDSSSSIFQSVKMNNSSNSISISKRSTADDSKLKQMIDKSNKWIWDKITKFEKEQEREERLSNQGNFLQNKNEESKKRFPLL